MSLNLPQDKPMLPGWLYMVIAAACFCMTGFVVRQAVLVSHVNIFWLGWGRFVFGLIVLSLPALLGAWSLAIHNKRVFILRGAYGSTGQFMFFAVVAFVGLGRGTALSYLMCLVGAISGIWILRERPARTLWLALGLAIVGVMLSCQAGFPRGAEWLGIGCALFSGITLPYVRLLRKTDSNVISFFSQSLFGSVLLFPLIFFFAPPNTLWQVTLIGMAGVTDMFGQFAMSHGLKHVDVAKGSALIMLTPVFGILAGVLMLGETLLITQWLGCSLVLVASLLALLGKSTHTPNNPQNDTQKQVTPIDNVL